MTTDITDLEQRVEKLEKRVAWAYRLWGILRRSFLSIVRNVEKWIEEEEG